ncbi:MAG: amino acid adenylation domain-containing protein, partial [Chloroflexi bacterium]
MARGVHGRAAGGDGRAGRADAAAARLLARQPRPGRRRPGRTARRRARRLGGRPARRVRPLQPGGGRTLPGGVGAVNLVPTAPAGLLRRIEAAAERRPEATAVESGGTRLTYADLNRAANRLARYLRGRGVGPEVRVAMCLDRSAQLVTAMLAVLKAGGAYVPLDPEYPADRLRYMLEASRAPVLLTAEASRERLGAAAAGAVCLDSAGGEWAGQPAGNLEPAAVPGNLAYVIFTSGSTGRPKGVMIDHSALRNLVEWNVRVYELTPDDRTTAIASPSFDPMGFEVWPALAAGASLLVPDAETRISPDRLQRWLLANRVTVSYVPTPLAERLLKLDWPADAPLRLLHTGGDRLSGRPAPGVSFRLMNHYGPTENTVASTVSAVGASRRPALPDIGRPIDNTFAMVLDEDLGRPGDGTAGELFLGGAGLARGYLDQPALTAERFVPNPLAARPGERLYRTGDLARWRPDGALEYIGRADRQVKIRGQRVELGEIEAVLSAHPDLQAAAVEAVASADGERRLVGYVSPRAGAEPAVRELRQYLAEVLPASMVPSAFVLLPELPATANGKVDRAALPPPAEQPDLDGARTAPRSPAEAAVAAIWRDVLGLERVGVEDDFFDLGGHSLLAERVSARMREAFGVEVGYRTLFESSTVAQQAALVAGAAAGPPAPAGRAAGGDEAPLSTGQRRLWLADQLDRGAAAYREAASVWLRGELRPDALRWALNEVVRRHAVLRTRFALRAGEPVQAVAAGLRLDLDPVAAAGEADALRMAGELAARPYDLTRGPLVRAGLFRLSATHHLLVVAMHHVVCDAWSVAILWRELAELYEARVLGRAPALPELTVQYADFAAWEAARPEGDRLDRQRAFWHRQLAGVTPSLDLPTGQRRRDGAGSAGHCRRPVPAGVVRRLEAVSRQARVTLFMTLLAAYQVVLARLSGQTDVVVGAPITRRPRADFEPLIGFFVNPLVLRTDLGGDPTFRELQGRVNEVALGAYDNQDVPFDDLVEEARQGRDLGPRPLLQYLFALQNIRVEGPRLPGVEARVEQLDRIAPMFDLELELEPREDGGLEARVLFDRDVFDPAAAERVTSAYVALLDAVAADPDRRIGDLPLDGERERRRLLVEWNDTGRPLPAGAGRAGIIDEHVAERPGSPALVFGDTVLTYAELDLRSRRLAARLRRLGVGPETVVGVCLERSPELAVAMVAVHRAGGAYLPLDPEYPRARLEPMVEDSGTALVLTTDQLADRLPAGRAAVVAVAGDDAAAGGGPPEPPAAPGNLAYVIYTSGSTGRPKGAGCTRLGLAALIEAQRAVLGITPGDRVLQFSSASFDASVFEMVLALASGAALVLATPAELAGGEPLLELLRRQRVTAAVLPPSVLREVPAADLPDLRTLTVAGEACGADLLATWAPGRRFLNLYGPTEATVWTTSSERLGGDDRPDIGRPIPNTTVYVLDRHLRPAPLGVAGELCIGGAGLARGYVGRPGLTAERFVPNPFAAGERLYRSGDLARWLPDGRLDFLGRIDHQVKVRGLRIEVGEIEAALA